MLFASQETDPPIPPFDTIWLQLNSPTATRLGGVFATSCSSGTMTGILTNGTILCSDASTSNNWLMLQQSGHGTAIGQYWGFGRDIDHSNVSLKEIPFPVNVTVTTIQARFINLNLCSGDVEWRLIKNGVDGGVAIVLPNTTVANVAVTLAINVEFDIGEEIAFQYNDLGTGCTPNQRGFSASGIFR